MQSKSFSECTYLIEVHNNWISVRTNFLVHRLNEYLNFCSFDVLNMWVSVYLAFKLNTCVHKFKALVCALNIWVSVYLTFHTWVNSIIEMSSWHRYSQKEIHWFELLLPWGLLGFTLSKIWAKMAQIRTI